MLKEKLTRAVKEAITACRTEDLIPDVGVPVEIISHGSAYATNAPVLLARRSENAITTAQTRAGVYAEQIAERINAHPDTPAIAEVGQDGMLHLKPVPSLYSQTLLAIQEAGADWGKNTSGLGKRALVEFVSANPNGLISIPHARGASIGDAIARLLEWNGYTVEREFYVNDAATAPQLHSLARAVFGAYREMFGADKLAINDDTDTYSGDYIKELATLIGERDGDRYVSLSPEAAATAFTPLIVTAMRDRQEASLSAFGIQFDQWFSEASMLGNGALQRILDTLMAAGHAYAQGGALWLRTTAFGDDGDRVLLRNDGTPSYYAGDLAYHADKLQTRAYDLAVDVWNADHQSYIGRTRAGLAALGINHVSDRLSIAVFGPVRTMQDGMELRTGRQASGMVTLDEIVAATGNTDALRFALLWPSPAQAAMDLNLDAVSTDRPLSVIRTLLTQTESLVSTTASPEEREALAEDSHAAVLIRQLDAFPETVKGATSAVAPSEVAHYALHLADTIRRFDSNGPGTQLLLGAARQTLINALTILGISAK